MSTKNTIKRAKIVMGVLTLLLAAIGFYGAYNTGLYILGVSEGNLETYKFSLTLVLASMFTLSIAFVIYEQYISSMRRK